MERATGARPGKDSDDVSMDSDSEDDENAKSGDEVTLPSLEGMFRVGQVVRCAVTEVDAGDSAKGGKGETGSDAKQRRRIELSIKPSRTNAGLGPKTLFEGLVSC